jgi:hypothetical protein
MAEIFAEARRIGPAGQDRAVAQYRIAQRRGMEKLGTPGK